MENQVDNEMEINLKDLGYYLLKRWRIGLLALLAGAIIAGGFKTVRLMFAYSDEEFQKQSSLFYEKSLKSYVEERKNLEYEITTLAEKIKETEHYNQNSILMRMNPYHTYLSTAELYVKTDYKIMPDKVYQAPDYTTSIMQYYAILLTKGQIIDDMAKAFSLEPVYLTELIKISTDVNSRVISIKIWYTDRETCEEMLNYLLAGINKRQGEIEEQIGVHTLSIMQQSTDEIVDEELASYQKSQLGQMKDLLSSQKEKELELENLKEPEPQTASMIKEIIRNMVLFGLFSFFAAVFLLSLYFITSDRILSSEEFRKRFGIPCFLLPERRTGTGFGTKLDNHLLRMESGRTVLTAEAAFGLMENYGKILLLGSVDEKEFSEKAAGLVQLKKAAGMAVFCGKSWNKETVNKLLQCDGVILVEKFNTSTYKTVQEEIEVILNMKKPVLGCVLLQS